MTTQTRGEYYEELEVGDVYEHRPDRTLSEFDNTLWSLLSVNLQPFHLDIHYSEGTEFGSAS